MDTCNCRAFPCRPHRVVGEIIARVKSWDCPVHSLELPMTAAEIMAQKIQQSAADWVADMKAKRR